MPEIYVADLAAYNNGELIGKWIDATQDPEDILLEITDMLKEKISMIARLIEEYGEPFVALYSYDDSYADNYQDWANYFEESYMGEYESMAHYAEEYLNDIGVFKDANDPIKTYFDYEKFGRDLEQEVLAIEAGIGIVYVFTY